jgi:hypothetical protein
MSTAIKNLDEARLAAEIVSVLDPSALRACSDKRDVIRYFVRANTLKLRTIILDRAALQRLLSSKDAAVKVEYLKRDLLRAASHRAEYRYPRLQASNRRLSTDFAIETMVKSRRA